MGYDSICEISVVRDCLSYTDNYARNLRTLLAELATLIAVAWPLEYLSVRWLELMNLG